MAHKVFVSVVLPVHNEEKNLKYLYKELTQELTKIKKNGKKYQIVFVDDGSSDGSYSLLTKLAQEDSCVTVVKLLSNYGQSTALAAGIEQAKGENIVTMDADLQHNPADIHTMLEPLERNAEERTVEFDVVCGWRKERGDSLIKKGIPSRFANYLVTKMAGWDLHDTIGGMKAFRKEVAQVVPLYGNMHRYLAVLAKWKGFRVTERSIEVRRRGAGKTHYTAKRLLGGFFDLLSVKFFISYSTRPFHIFAKVGLASFSAGFLIGAYYLFQKIVYGIHLMEEVASLVLSVLLILLGVNFICFGFIADMISFDAITSKRNKMYLVEKVVEKN